MNMDYKIEFFSNWHCGSGLAAGADVDASLFGIGQTLKPYPTNRCVSGDGNVTYI